MRVGFGRLQDDLARIARFPVVEDDNTWTLLSYSEFVRRFPKTAIRRKGCLDFMACGMDCHYVEKQSPHTLGGFKAFGRPMVLQHGNASCIFVACEQSVPAMSIEAILGVARHVPMAILGDVPDAHSANERARAATYEQLPDNVFATDASCAAHQCHRIVQSVEREMVGNVYAVHVTCSHYANSGRIAASFRALLDELDYFVGEPPPAFEHRNRSVMSLTLLRRRCLVACDETDTSVLERGALEEGAVEKFLRVWNGDWTSPKVFLRSAWRVLPSNWLENGIGALLLNVRSWRVGGGGDMFGVHRVCRRCANIRRNLIRQHT